MKKEGREAKPKLDPLDQKGNFAHFELGKKLYAFRSMMWKDLKEMKFQQYQYVEF